jgi:hypothetical protein
MDGEIGVQLQQLFAEEFPTRQLELQRITTRFISSTIGWHRSITGLIFLDITFRYRRIMEILQIRPHLLRHLNVMALTL